MLKAQGFCERIDGVTGDFTVYKAVYPGDRREQARYDTREEREAIAKQLLECSLMSENHWLAASYLDAAHHLWGNDETWRTVSARAGHRMRKMAQAERDLNVR